MLLLQVDVAMNRQGEGKLQGPNIQHVGPRAKDRRNLGKGNGLATVNRQVKARYQRDSGSVNGVTPAS